MMEQQVHVVFVHGILSGPQVFDDIARHITADPMLEGISVQCYEYSSPRVVVNPARVIPDITAIADGLWTYLGLLEPAGERIYLVGHSQGALAIQFMLARGLNQGRGRELGRIIGVSLLACPTQGSSIALTLRRTLFGRHAQERQLRPYIDAVNETHTTVIQRIENAASVTSSSCPIPITAYVGETDGVVPTSSARGSFGTVHVLPGGHAEILSAPSAASPVVRALKRDILESLRATRAVSAEPQGQDLTEPPPAQEPIIASHDLFLSHASEDKPFVTELATELKQRGYSVWMDSIVLKIGDSLSQRIDDGLAKSSYGVVVLSEHFFSKQWTRHELSGLVARELAGAKVVLPIWHGVDRAAVARHSPTLADRLAIDSSEGVARVCDQIARVVRPSCAEGGLASLMQTVAQTPSVQAHAPGLIAAPIVDSEEEERRITIELRGAYGGDEVCPRCNLQCKAYGYDGSDGDSFDWLECGHCGLFLPLS